MLFGHQDMCASGIVSSDIRAMGISSSQQVSAHDTRAICLTFPMPELAAWGSHSQDYGEGGARGSHESSNHSLSLGHVTCGGGRGPTSAQKDMHQNLQCP